MISNNPININIDNNKESDLVVRMEILRLVMVV